MACCAGIGRVRGRDSEGGVGTRGCWPEETIKARVCEDALVARQHCVSRLHGLIQVWYNWLTCLWGAGGLYRSAYQTGSRYGAVRWFCGKKCIFAADEKHAPILGFFIDQRTKSATRSIKSLSWLAETAFFSKKVGVPQIDGSKVGW